MCWHTDWNENLQWQKLFDEGIIKPEVKSDLPIFKYLSRNHKHIAKIEVNYNKNGICKKCKTGENK